MPCPRNMFGQADCNIVEHPDRPDVSFCATCGKRFRYGGVGGLLWFVLVVLFSVWVLRSMQLIPPRPSTLPPSLPGNDQQ